MKNQIKQPDLNAPRFRPTRLSLFTPAFYKEFRKKYPQHKDVPNSTLRGIILSHSIKMWETVIDERDGIELPENMGNVFIGTCNPPRAHNTDYAVSLKYNTRLRHRNFESDNYVAKIFYTNYAPKYKFKDRDLWQFKGVRDFTRKVSETYPENWKKYIQVENFQKINKLFATHGTKNYFARCLEKDIKDYNEFDLD